MQASGFTLIAVAVGIVALIFAGMVILQKRNKPRVLAWADQTYAREGIVVRDEGAYFVGLASQKPKPAGGYGLFGLTGERIFFRAYLGPFLLDIPFGRILDASIDAVFQVSPGITRSHRSRGSDRLLILRFRDEHGAEDSCAFSVAEGQQLFDRIRQQMHL